MNLVRKSLSSLLVLFLVATPALADFKYTDTSQITGGALMGMANFAAKFSKDSRAAMQPITTTHYIKGNKMRTDGSDGSIQIIDLDGRRVISIDNEKKTYSVATFDQIKAAMEKAQAETEKPAAAPAQGQDAQQLQVTPKITVLPGTGTRTILGQDTKETKIKMDMEMQAQNANGQPAQASTPGQPNSITFTMTMDTYVAPSVSGYQEIGEFYKKMATEINWMPPSNIHVDPRMSQGMSELAKNSDALRGLPMLSYTTMSIPPQPGMTSNTSQASSNPPPSDNSKSTDSGSSVPTSGSDAVMKGLGSLFNKKKKQQQDDNAKAGTPAPPPNPNPDPNALMEMTTQVSSYSDSPLDASLFDIPAGYRQVQGDPNQMFLAPAATHKH
jgi:hypothetical protein